MSKYEAGKTVNHFFIKKTEKRGKKIYCLVVCPICKQEKWMRTDNVNNSKSCGCERKLDLTGQRFGRLTVVEKAENYKNRTRWLCKCDCKSTTIVRTEYLRSETVKSCGCLRKQTGAEQAKKIKHLFNKKYLKDGTNLAIISKTKPTQDNETGVRGVFFDKHSGRYVAHLIFKGKYVLRKKFKTFEEAVKARKEAEEKYYKPILDKYKK